MTSSAPAACRGRRCSGARLLLVAGVVAMAALGAGGTASAQENTPPTEPAVEEEPPNAGTAPPEGPTDPPATATTAATSGGPGATSPSGAAPAARGTGSVAEDRFEVDLPVGDALRAAVRIGGPVSALLALALVARFVVRRVLRSRALATPAVVRAAIPPDPGRALARCCARTSRLVLALPPAMLARLLDATAVALREPDGDVAVASVAQRWAIPGGSEDAHRLLVALGATAGGGASQLVVAAADAVAFTSEEAISRWLAAVAEAHVGVADLGIAMSLPLVLASAARVADAAAAPADDATARDARRVWDATVDALAPVLGPPGLARAEHGGARVGEVGADLVTRLSGLFALARNLAIDVARPVGSRPDPATMALNFSASPPREPRSVRRGKRAGQRAGATAKTGAAPEA